ncbi:MAG: FecR domain-containing protein [Chitinophagaceae bacterium]|nr:FecR domain-containing protein [Chitinophagaceae bacterium]
MPSPQTLYQLIQKYQAGTATAEEIAQLNEWYHSFDDTQAEVYLEQSTTESELAERIRIRLAQTISQEPVQSRRKRYILPIAASFLLLIVSGGLYFLLNKNKAPQPVAEGKPQIVTPTNTDIAPGGNKALLTLADGSIIELDSAANGVLGKQGVSEIVKLKSGQLAYKIDGRFLTENDEAFYNTITTPRGGQYQVTLSDGTKVWLNAASSIRFPVVFTGKERRVEVTGETYFEVKSDATRPFYVKAEQSEVEVIGTHFNINAYTDEESLKVTLLEGKVRVSSSVTLLPGQQAQLSSSNQITTSNNVDLEEVMAWKNGRFQFKSADLQSILRQISRWYDVDVEYRGKVNLHFTGQLTRNQNVSKVFEHLEMTGEVHFRTEGKKIIVTR